MIIDLTRGKDKTINIPMDMISMSDVYKRYNLNCINRTRVIVSLLSSLGVSVYNVGGYYFCSKADIDNLGRKKSISKELKQIIDLLINREMSRQEIQAELNLNPSTCFYRINKLRQFGILKERRSAHKYNLNVFTISDKFLASYTKE